MPGLNALNKYAKKEGGFTLIELVLVVVIIGILASLAVPAYSRYMSSAKAGEALAHLNALVQYAHSYAQAHPNDWSQTGMVLYYDGNDSGTETNDTLWVKEVCGLTPVYFSYSYEGPAGGGGNAVLVATGGRTISANGLPITGSPFTSTDWLRAQVNSDGTITWTASTGKMQEVVPSD